MAIKEKYMDLVASFNNIKNVKVVLSAILPRKQGQDSFGYNLNKKIRVFNNWLKFLADQLKMGFVSGYEHFEKRGDLYRADGLHLNEDGVKVFARILKRAAES